MHIIPPALSDFPHDPILSRLSATAFIRGRRSGSASTHPRATWNAATTSFRAPPSRSTPASASSDSGRASSNPCRTHLTTSGTACAWSPPPPPPETVVVVPENDADEEVDADGEAWCSGRRPVSSSSSTTPKGRRRTSGWGARPRRGPPGRGTRWGGGGGPRRRRRA